MAAVLVLSMLVFSLVDVSVKQAQGTTGTIDRVQSLFVAHSGIWAGANWLSQGNDANPLLVIGGPGIALSGNAYLAGGSYADQALNLSGGALVEDADGFLAWSSDDAFRQAADGYFEVRVKRVTLTTLHVRSRGVDGGVLRTIEGWTRRTAVSGTGSPFARGTSGLKPLVLNSAVTTDSYNSKKGMVRQRPTDDGYSWAGLPSTPQPKSSYFDSSEHGKFRVFGDQDGVDTTTINDPIHGGAFYLKAPGATAGNPDDPADAKAQADKANGDIASNEGITFNSGARVFGDAKPGPGPDNDPSTTGDNYSVDLGGSGNNWAHGDTSVLDANMEAPLPTFTPPVTSTTGGTGIPTHGSSPNYNSSTTEWDFSGTGGNPQLVLNSLELNSNTTLNIKGEAGQVIDIYVTDGGEEAIKINSSSHITITDGAGNAGYDLDPTTPTLQGPRVRLWTNGGISLNSKSTVNYQGDPIQFMFFSKKNDISKKTVVHNSDSASQAVWYAPGGRVEFNSAAEYFGAVVGGDVYMNSAVKFHYDESLADLDKDGNPATSYLYVPEATVVIEQQ